jgi:hypothetical protein
LVSGLVLIYHAGIRTANIPCYNNPMQRKTALILGILIVGSLAVVASAQLMRALRRGLPATSEPTRKAQSVGIPLQDWPIYRDKSYGFKVAYPSASEGWAFLTPSLGQAPLHYSPVSEPFSLYTKRTSEEGTTIFVGVYQKSTDIPAVKDWLRAGYAQGMHGPEYSIPVTLADRPGDITTALSRAHDGNRGLLSYRHTVRGTLRIYELGVVDAPGKLWYSTYFTRDGRSIFVLTLLLPISSPYAPHDPDSLFVTTYDRMVATFELIR